MVQEKQKVFSGIFVIQLCLQGEGERAAWVLLELTDALLWY